MGFFKEAEGGASSKAITRLHQLIWLLIYGGLLTLVLGLTVQRLDDAVGWSMVVGGGAAASLGCVLIYLRSRMRSD